MANVIERINFNLLKRGLLLEAMASQRLQAPGSFSMFTLLTLGMDTGASCLLSPVITGLLQPFACRKGIRDLGDKKDLPFIKEENTHFLEVHQ